jgi:copper resistance protein C
MRSRLRTLGVALLAAALGGLTAVPAAAHDALLRTEPADGAVLATAPSRVRLVFSDRVLPMGTRVQVTAPDGTVPAVPDPSVTGASVDQPLPPAPAPGRYTVLWRVASADGHPVSGRLTFTVTGPASTSAATSAVTSAAASVAPAGPSIVSSPAVQPVATTTTPDSWFGSWPGVVTIVLLVGSAAVAAAVAVARPSRRPRP